MQVLLLTKSQYRQLWSICLKYISSPPYSRDQVLWAAEERHEAPVSFGPLPVSPVYHLLCLSPHWMTSLLSPFLVLSTLPACSGAY